MSGPMALANAQTQPMIPEKTPRSDRGSMSATTTMSQYEKEWLRDTPSIKTQDMYRLTDLGHREDTSASHPLNSPGSDQHVHGFDVPSSTAKTGTEHESDE